MELRVAQSRLRNPIQRRRRDHAAEGAGDAIASVVGHDQQDVGRALRAARCAAPTKPWIAPRLSLITPPNFGLGAGSCFPSMVVVALGEPGVPVTCCANDGPAVTLNSTAPAAQLPNSAVSTLVLHRFSLF